MDTGIDAASNAASDAASDNDMPCDIEESATSFTPAGGAAGSAEAAGDAAAEHRDQALTSARTRRHDSISFSCELASTLMTSMANSAGFVSGGHVYPAARKVGKQEMRSPK